MRNQLRQYVILAIVLLFCAVNVFLGVRSILHSNDEVTTFTVGDWEGITFPRYNGPAIYSTAAPRAHVVSLPNVSSSSNALFHHHAVMSYSGGRVATPQAQMSSTAHKIYQTSDQHVRSLGSGAGAGGNATTGTTSYSSSTTSTYNIPHIALALPSVRTRTLANNNNIIAANNAQPSIIVETGVVRRPRASGIRRAMPDEDGSYDGQLNDNGDYIWDEYDGKWVPKPDNNAQHPHNSDLVWVDGQGWRPTSDLPEPGTPIGDIPFILLLMFAAAYSVHRVRKTKTVTNL